VVKDEILYDFSGLPEVLIKISNKSGHASYSNSILAIPKI